MVERLKAIFQHWRWHILILGSSVLILGCSANPVRDYCAISQPIRLTKAEIAQLSDESAKQILAANETRARLCK
jgi:hypothetical protein